MALMISSSIVTFRVLWLFHDVSAHSLGRLCTDVPVDKRAVAIGMLQQRVLELQNLVPQRVQFFVEVRVGGFHATHTVGEYAVIRLLALATLLGGLS